MDATRKTRTAVHEAGHAVAHVRLDIQQGDVNIIPDGDMLGRSMAEGVDHVWTVEAAHDQVLAYCAGYAALLAAGYPDRVARVGADDDFEHAAHLIDFWSLPHSLDDYQAQAVGLMGKNENVRAVKVVADALLEHRHLPVEYVDALVMLADGEITREEWDRFCVTYEQLRAHG